MQSPIGMHWFASESLDLRAIITL